MAANKVEWAPLDAFLDEVMYALDRGWVTGVFPVDLSIRNPAEQISGQDVPEERLLTLESSTGTHEKKGKCYSLSLSDSLQQHRV